jgi:curved DNA-binding protein CbpA
MTPSPYAILGVSQRARLETIKAAWRRFAMRHHPDRGGDAAKLHQGKRAYTLLADAEARKRYDATGEWPEDTSQHQNPDADIWGAAAELLMGAVMQDLDPREDVLSAARRHVDEMIRKNEAEVLKLDAAITRAPKFTERITRKGEGENMLRRVLEGRCAELARAVWTTRKKIELQRRLLKFLDEYAWRTDARPQVFTFWGGNGATSSTTS